MGYRLLQCTLFQRKGLVGVPLEANRLDYSEDLIQFIYNYSNPAHQRLNYQTTTKNLKPWLKLDTLVAVRLRVLEEKTQRTFSKMPALYYTLSLVEIGLCVTAVASGLVVSSLVGRQTVSCLESHSCFHTVLFMIIFVCF